MKTGKRLQKNVHNVKFLLICFTIYRSSQAEVNHVIVNDANIWNTNIKELRKSPRFQIQNTQIIEI